METVRPDDHKRFFNISARRRVQLIEDTAQAVFALCAYCAVFAVAAISLYMFANGIPAVFRLGIKELFFSAAWRPTAQDPSFGIAYIVLTSIVGTVLAIVISVPAALLTAVFLAQIASKRLATAAGWAIELLAGVPSVIYGLLGMMILNPWLYRWEERIFRHSVTHQFTGGANLLAAVLVLSVMILPTVISVSEAAIRAVPPYLIDSSLALGASHIQTIFRVVLPAARPGIITAIVLGVGRAVGEAMAISMVSGGSVNLPLPFGSVRFLTTALVSEMGYATRLHRQVLFTIGLVLFVFIMVINMAVSRIFHGQEK